MARNSKDVPSSSICGRPPDFPSGLPRGKLWSPENAGAPPSPKASNQSRGNLIAQPETRPISSEQLIAEVKGIYAGLVMVESKCIEVDNSQTENDAALNNEQWQALIALHRTLLLENHDFFLASQHPSASQALRRLASKYAMPARLWRHGVTVPAFEDTWMGDLGRYSQHKARRGRGTRRNAAYWKERNSDANADLFDERELLFSNEHGGLKVSRLANLDTQLKITQGKSDDLIMSSHCARELGILEDISPDFEDPCLQSISGHSTAVKGILRNIQFRLKGSSVTFRRNFWICDAINGIVDIMIGANFIKDNFKMLFEKVKECASTFATWFSKKKETPEQKKEREELERQQKIRINELEIKRLQRENEMHQRASERNSHQNNTQSGG